MIASFSGNGRRGDATSGAAGWLGLAATPTFAVMAVLTYVSRDEAAMLLCSAGHGESLLSGMIPMYVLMSAFHSTSWLNLMARWRYATVTVRTPTNLPA